MLYLANHACPQKLPEKRLINLKQVEGMPCKLQAIGNLCDPLVRKYVVFSVRADRSCKGFWVSLILVRMKSFRSIWWLTSN